MRKLISKFKYRRANRERVWDPDEYMNEREAVEYSKARGCPLTISRLRASRMAKPTCVGPRFEKFGWSVFYKPRYLDEFIVSMKPYVVDPAKRMAAAS